MIRFITAMMISLWALGAQAQVVINEITSPGGIKAWYINEPSVPFTARELMFIGGTAIDPAGKAGAANLMTGLLEEGAGDMDAQGFAIAQEALAAQFKFNVYDETLTVSARFLSENRDQAVDLLKTALTQPRFDQDAIDRVRGQVLSIIASKETDPNAIAGRNFYQIAFGTHPYAWSQDGTNTTVQALTRDDMVATHDRLLTRNNLVVSAVGDITGGELAALLDHLLGDLPVGDTPRVPPVTPALTGGQTVVDFPVPQSVALFGHAGIAHDHPDYAAAYVLNVILGGRGYESRLTAELRENRGLTYGVGTFLVNKDQADMIMGSVASANDRMAEAVGLIKDIWRDTAENGVSAAELDAAKLYITGSYALRFDGNGPIAGILGGMQRHGYDRDYIHTRNERINAVTLDDINRVAASLLRVDDLHFVIVGQPTGL